MPTYTIYRLDTNNGEGFPQWISALSDNIRSRYGFNRDYQDIADVPGGFTPLHNTLYIRTQNSQDGRTRIYTFFTKSPEEKFGIRFLLTAHENFEQDFRQEIDDKKIEGGYGYITILPIAQTNPVFTTDNGTQITLTRDGMRISQANALATNLDDVFGDEKAQTTIHLYILALAYSTKLTTIDQETIRAFKEEKFQKILIFHSEIVDLNPSIPLNPAKQDTWKIRELWESIATHTNLQKTHNKVKERIIMLTKNCDSSSQRNTEIEIFIFTMVSVCLTALYTVKEFLTSPVEIATYALLIPALFLALIAWLSIISKERQTKPLKFITWCLLFFASIFALAFAYVTTQNNSFASPRINQHANMYNTKIPVPLRHYRQLLLGTH